MRSLHLHLLPRLKQSKIAQSSPGSANATSATALLWCAILHGWTSSWMLVPSFQKYKWQTSSRSIDRRFFYSCRTSLSNGSGRELAHFKGLSFPTVSASGPNAGTRRKYFQVSKSKMPLRSSYHPLYAWAFNLCYSEERSSLFCSARYKTVKLTIWVRFIYATREVGFFACW